MPDPELLKQNMLINIFRDFVTAVKCEVRVNDRNTSNKQQRSILVILFARSNKYCVQRILAAAHAHRMV
jgi:hypothetical protein